MHAVYSCFPACAESSHSEFISLWIEWSTLVAAETFFCTFVLNDSFLFSQTSNYLTWVLDFITVFVTPKGDHLLSQRYSELYLNTPSKPLRWLSKKCRRPDLNSQPQRPLPGSIPSLMLQTARFYARLYYHVQTWAHNLLRQKVITYWVSTIVSYISTVLFNKVISAIGSLLALEK